jgi:hypothetical protein
MDVLQIVLGVMAWCVWEQADFKESTMEIYAHGGVGFVLDILTVCKTSVRERRKGLLAT